MSTGGGRLGVWVAHIWLRSHIVHPFGQLARWKKEGYIWGVRSLVH